MKDKKMIKIFEKFQVKDCKNITEFCEKYYKSSRFTERGVEYVKECIKSHKEDYIKNGYTILSHHESKTGGCVSFI